MPTTDKFSKKVVSTEGFNGQQEIDKLLVKDEIANSSEQDSNDENEFIGKPEDEEFKIEYVWRNIIFFIFMHLCIPYAFYVGIRDLKVYLFFWRKF